MKEIIFFIQYHLNTNLKRVKEIDLDILYRLLDIKYTISNNYKEEFERWLIDYEKRHKTDN